MAALRLIKLKEEVWRLWDPYPAIHSHVSSGTEIYLLEAL